MKGRKKRWEFELIDAWSIPHFLFGSVMAMVTLDFDFPVWPLFFTTFIMALVWEYIEYFFGLGEGRTNVISDIFMPLISFPLTVLLFDSPVIHHEQHTALLTIILVFYSLACYAAWRARFDRDPDFLK